MQQRRLPKALDCVAEAVLLVQLPAFLEQTIRQIIRNEEMAPRHDAFCEFEKGLDAAFVSVAHQSLHKCLTKSASASQLPLLLPPNTNVKHVPLLPMSFLWRDTTKNGLQTLHADSGRQAIYGVCRELRDKRVRRARQ